MIFSLGFLVAQNRIGLGVPGQLPENVSNIRFQTVAQGVDGLPGTSGVMVFNEPTGWSNYWRANHRSVAPFLERGFFNDWRLVAIHLGARPTQGYAVNILRMDRRIDRATITTLETVPPRGSRPSAGATAPWIVLQVERGAYDFNLVTQRVEGYASGARNVAGGTTVQVGGATVTFGPGGNGCPPR